MRYRLPEIEHRYGDRVHILHDPLATTLLAQLCSPTTVQPAINRLAATLYRQMVCSVINNEMSTVMAEWPTRMTEIHADKLWSGPVLDPKARVAVVCVARAGIFPSQVCYDFLNELLDPTCVRQDHMLMNRTTDASGHVRGAAIQGAKIGGPVDGTTLFIPDPMGATGTTIATLLDHYAEHVPGRPDGAVALNLIITPEYIRRVTEMSDKTKIYAFRVDRGMSPPDVQRSIPGEHWDRERGLDERGYIVPGAGGFGEIMNNAFV